MPWLGETSWSYSSQASAYQSLVGNRSVEVPLTQTAWHSRSWLPKSHGSTIRLAKSGIQSSLDKPILVFQINLYMYVYECIRMYTYVYMCSRVCIYIYISIHSYIHTYKCIIHVCVYMYIRRPLPSLGLGGAAPGITVGVRHGPVPALASTARNLSKFL